MVRANLPTRESEYEFDVLGGEDSFPSLWHDLLEEIRAGIVAMMKGSSQEKANA